MLKVDAAHIRLHMPVVGVHAEEAGPEERLVVAYGIERCHHRVDVAMIGKHRHVDRRAERPFNLLGRAAALLHHPVALALPHGTVHDLLHLGGREVLGKWRVGLRLVLLIKYRLEVAGHMAIDRLLGILLHLVVDGGVDLQSIGIDVVERAILLRVFLAPTAQRICGKGY